jgi:hypothetical protein
MRRYAKLLRGTLPASLMLVAMAGAAVAKPLQDATAAYQRGDYTAAWSSLDHWLTKATPTLGDRRSTTGTAA